MTLVLAALTLLGLGIFGPGIANGLVSGGPQLGAGAAIGTGLAVGGAVAAGAGLAAGGVGLAGGAIAGAARGGSAALSGVSAAYRSGNAAGAAETGVSAVTNPLRRMASTFASDGQAGERAAASSADRQPDFARRAKQAQTISAWRIRGRACPSLQRSRRSRHFSRSLRRRALMRRRSTNYWH